ncbi:hypothetical protein A6U86_29950 [Rhizobium sp. AC27/96]|nr:hypothetical protein A6U86_29950 [Rhizobium sp. AC27/96]
MNKRLHHANQDRATGVSKLKWIDVGHRAGQAVARKHALTDDFGNVFHACPTTMKSGAPFAAMSWLLHY